MTESVIGGFERGVNCVTDCLRFLRPVGDQGVRPVVGVLLAVGGCGGAENKVRSFGLATGYRGWKRGETLGNGHPMVWQNPLHVGWREGGVDEVKELLVRREVDGN